MEVKRHWLGQDWYLPGDAGNEINKVCVASWEFQNVEHCDRHFHFVGVWWFSDR
jgi:hypothetical protein